MKSNLKWTVLAVAISAVGVAQAQSEGEGDDPIDVNIAINAELNAQADLLWDYKRVDRDGTFHTLWSGDRSEIEAVDTH